MVIREKGEHQFIGEYFFVMITFPSLVSLANVEVWILTTEITRIPCTSENSLTLLTQKVESISPPSENGPALVIHTIRGGHIWAKQKSRAALSHVDYPPCLHSTCRKFSFPKFLQPGECSRITSSSV